MWHKRVLCVRETGLENQFVVAIPLGYPVDTVLIDSVPAMG